VIDPLSEGGPSQPVEPSKEAQIVAGREFQIERKLLGHDTERSARFDRLSSDVDPVEMRGARVGCHEPTENSDGCRLTGAVWTE
jgi:hypothetical protein